MIGRRPVHFTDEIRFYSLAAVSDHACDKMREIEHKRYLNLSEPSGALSF